MYRIAKEFHFSASHQLLNLPDEHPCTRLHGHNYRVILELGAERLNAAGFVIDFGDLKPFKDYIDDTLDHRHLNDIFGPDVSPSAENIAAHLFDVALHLFGPITLSVTVYETEKAYARYGPAD
ncbi:MAG: 6-carboxytetrahydropterin synthase [bacterium]